LTLYLGIDGGGTKTEFVLIDDSGDVILSTRRESSAYYLEIGMQGLRELLVTTIRDMLASRSLTLNDLSFAFLGLPAYGENSTLLPQLDNILLDLLPKPRYHCANDVVCGWAGALAGEEGIAVVAGTGSIAYGELAARRARSGGWGELFGDEGSAYWLAREALALFSRMSDGRTPRGPLYSLVRRHFGIENDLDLCAKIYGPPALSRSELAALSRLAADAAQSGDASARHMFDSAAQEVAALVHAVRDALGVTPDLQVATSYCGGLLEADGPLLPRFEQALQGSGRAYDLRPPRLRPAAGAAVAAARLAGMPLSPAAVQRLENTRTEAYVR
jgi:N-acetylglucosamine kinase-like BadF-type ATPase